MKLNHLIFADDVILCCGGGFPSVYTMLQVFKLFSASSGLNISETKSEFYSASMDVHCVQRIKDASGFAYSSLPFQYLGVPTVQEE